MQLRTTLRRSSHLAALLLLCGPGLGQHRLVTQGNGRLALFEADGSVSWELPWGGIHDLHVLPGGNLMLQAGSSKVVEIDVESRAVVWSYDSAVSNGNAGRAVEVHSFQPLADGSVMIAESGPARIIEVNRAGELLRSVPLVVDRPHPHTDTRLVRKLDSGNYLVCHEGDGHVREYTPEGEVVWDFAVPLFGREPAGGHGPESFGNKCFAALRLEGGNTLVATGNGHSVLEVTPGGELVWRLEQGDLPGITLAWVTTLQLLPGGNLVLGNCHAGPGQPLLVELVRETKEVVWTFDRYESLGNSVSNALVLSEAPVFPEAVTEALEQARKDNTRVLVVCGEDGVRSLLERELRRLILYEFELVHLGEDDAFAAAHRPTGQEGGLLVVLDAQGAVLGRGSSRALVASKGVGAFLEAQQAAPLDAEQVLADALREARVSRRKAFVHLSAPW